MRISDWSSDVCSSDLVVVPSPRGRSVIHDKIVSNVQEVRARGARTIVIAEEGDTSIEPYAAVLIPVPAVPTLLQPIVARSDERSVGKACVSPLRSRRSPDTSKKKNQSI